jgi:hypothetical protein
MTTFLAWAREEQATVRTSFNSRADHIKNICSSMCASNSMDKGKCMDAIKSWANYRRNTCNSMSTNNSIDMGKSMDASKSIDIRNSRVTVDSKDACNSRKPTTEMLKI